MLPVHAVTLGGVLRCISPFWTSYLFRKASERTVDSGPDLRWGRNGKRFRRLLHPNGVCLSGDSRNRLNTRVIVREAVPTEGMDLAWTSFPVVNSLGSHELLLGAVAGWYASAGAGTVAGTVSLPVLSEGAKRRDSAPGTQGTRDCNQPKVLESRQTAGH